MKNASAGERFPAAEHPFAVDFQRSLKLVENLPVKTSKLHSLRQKETKSKPSKHFGTKQTVTHYLAGKPCWKVSPSTEFYIKMPINILYLNPLHLNMCL